MYRLPHRQFAFEPTFQLFMRDDSWKSCCTRFQKLKVAVGHLCGSWGNPIGYTLHCSYPVRAALEHDTLLAVVYGFFTFVSVHKPSVCAPHSSHASALHPQLWPYSTVLLWFLTSGFCLSYSSFQVWRRDAIWGRRFYILLQVNY